MPDCVTARSGPGSAVGAVCSRGAEQHTTAAAGTTTSDGYAEAAGPAVAAVHPGHPVASVPTSPAGPAVAVQQPAEPSVTTGAAGPR